MYGITTERPTPRSPSIAHGHIPVVARAHTGGIEGRRIDEEERRALGSSVGVVALPRDLTAVIVCVPAKRAVRLLQAPDAIVRVKLEAPSVVARTVGVQRIARIAAVTSRCAERSALWLCLARV